MSTQYLFVASIMAALQELQINSAKLQVQTQIMDQSLAIMLPQLCYSKISFIVLVPDHHRDLNVTQPRRFWSIDIESSCTN